ncbi:MAG: hypothetical protein IT427_06425 [Pirellulales bacterium]|nr:hypothetical protein [Pirellulales bacterium]
MTITNLLEFLVGRREAILRIAATPQAEWLGLLFVLSAGFAREYDAEDLTREPWYVLIPVAASLATSFGLYYLIRKCSSARVESANSFWTGYRSFLALYWMTAPLAWLYAIPVERFLTPADAVAGNLILLGIVSSWRVILMVRIVQVMFRFHALVAIFLVMLFVDGVAMVVLWFTPLPIFNIMGGIPMTEGETLIRSTATMVAVLGVLSFPVWLIGLGIFSALTRNGLQKAEAIPPQLKAGGTAEEASSRVSQSLWALAIASVIVWFAILPFTQPQQRCRYDVEKLMHAGQIKQAIELMCAHKPGDFPPHWNPPPRVAYSNSTPPLFDVLNALATIDARPWVEDLYFAKLQLVINEGFRPTYLLRGNQGNDRTAWLELLARTPRGLAFVRDNITSFETMAAEYGKKGNGQKILELIEKARSEKTTRAESRSNQ